MRSLGLLATLAALAACGGKTLRYEAGAFSVVVSKGVWVEHAPSGAATVFTFRATRDGPVCATVELIHQGGGACAGERLAAQKGQDPHCEDDGARCFACVEYEGSAAQLHARAEDDLECDGIARGLLRTLRVKPALHN